MLPLPSIKDTLKNIVNNIVIVMSGARWVHELSGDNFVNYIIV